ncbi:tRNA1Val (adenine37-N6)-methyltransferase [Formosa sp. Hel1_31_208]|uniref:tRNA1(Val) (adenine(37)-N6)-methyltransferase n=1 Tax=Formosa sp. Hel1_31_208 TaxID=1798225 RepID=UPI00087C74B5|nr:methyltransferase [Formosa sp. Hel1_31_208]SDR84750.1 tRNA1Val (adenine37-N6)-methyltransferase [Formosa sp. Hel1_31_208]
MEQPFQFKQFLIHQDQCAMKIGTDGVLIGAWTSINENPVSILDIGAGTGVLSLMLAQRCMAEAIDALEIDDKAYEQCVRNFENSSWGDRLFCYHASLEEFADEIDDEYDLIISNPPFYSPSLVSTALQKGENSMSDARKKARFQDAMPFKHLIESVAKLLSKNGRFSVVVPFSEEEQFIKLASESNLFPLRILRVKGSPSSEIKRSLMEFTFSNSKIQSSELIIETTRHLYTEDYINLTKDFYLKM